MAKRRYFLTQASSQVEDYLGFWGQIERKGTKYYVVSSPEEYMNWQVGRLASGWMLGAGDIFETQEEAERTAKSLGETAW